MQVHSIISNTISEEILKSGYLSIRFRTDGFSLLLEDSNFKPIILNNFFNETILSLSSYIQACEDWLNKHTLMDDFFGETSILIESPAANLIPVELFSEEQKNLFLEASNTITNNDSVLHKKIKNRPFVLVYAVSALILAFSEKLKSKHRIMHTSECMLSAADQIDASDHQRGFVMIESQLNHMEILAIKNDKLLLSNRYKLKNSNDIVYHTLNTMKQLKMEREKVPLFTAGIYNNNHESIQLLGKYVKYIRPLPYFIREIKKDSIQENIILSEATKCE